MSIRDKIYKRPRDFFDKPIQVQKKIDQQLGITGKDLEEEVTEDDVTKFLEYFCSPDK